MLVGRFKEGGVWDGVDLPGDFDALPATALVAVGVRAALRRVFYFDAVDPHRVWALGVVGCSTGPFDGSVRHGRVATGPDTEAKVHGRLGEVVAAISFCVLERTNESSIDEPVDLLGRPIDGVVVEVLLGFVDRIVNRTIIGRGVSLSKVVGFGVSGVAAHQFPVDLVQVVGFKHDTADDALA